MYNAFESELLQRGILPLWWWPRVRPLLHVYILNHQKNESIERSTRKRTAKQTLPFHLPKPELPCQRSICAYRKQMKRTGMTQRTSYGLFVIDRSIDLSILAAGLRARAQQQCVKKSTRQNTVWCIATAFQEP